MTARRRSRSPSRVAARPHGDHKRIAVIGSSGGSTLRANAAEELQTLSSQLKGLAIDVRLYRVLFVEVPMPLDHADATNVSGTLTTGLPPYPLVHDRLHAINKKARESDEAIAQDIRTGHLDAVIYTSADLQPGGVNRASLEALIDHGTPCLGTGGTSLGIAVESGANLLQLSGSVSTTSDSRAMAAAAALARHWRVPFTPQLPAPDLQVLPVLDAALPATLTISLLSAFSLALQPLLTPQGNATASIVFDILTKHGFPAILAALTARRSALLGETGVIVGLLAGAISSASAAPLFSSVGVASYPSAAAALSSLIGAMASGLAARQVLGYTHMLGLPATASTLITVGGAGVVGGCVGLLVLLPSLMLCAATHAAVALLCSGPVAARAAMGFALGVLTKWGSMAGYYHSVMFPLIMVEMTTGGSFSVLGAFDVACLCCVCAGVCTGIALTSPSPVEARACRRAARINLLLGDYVEACYPFMERSRSVRLGAMLSAGLAGAALLGAGDGPVLSSAYLPVPLGVAIANGQSRTMALACGLAFVPAFLATYASHSASSTSPPARREMKLQ
jgi:hypothetical protein